MAARIAEEVARTMAELQPASSGITPVQAMAAGPAAQDRPSRTLAANDPVIGPARQITSPALPMIAARSSFGLADRKVDTISGAAGSGIPALSSHASSLRLRSLELALAPEGAVAELPANFEPIASICWMQVPRAEAAERFVQAQVTLSLAAPAGIVLPKLHGFTLDPVQAPEADSSWMRVPPAEAAERFVQTLDTGAIQRTLEIAGPRLEGLSIDAPQALETSTCWMPVPRAEAAERWISTSMACAMEVTARPAIAPAISGFAVDSVYLPVSSRLMLPPAAEPVMSEVVSRGVAAFTAFAPSSLLLPTAMPALNDLGQDSAQVTAPAHAPAADPVESMPAIPGFVAAPISMAPAVTVPLVHFAVSTAISAAPFESLTPAAVRPEEQLPNSRPARLHPISSLTVKAPSFRPVKARAKIPTPALNPMEYYCHRIVSAPVSRPEWTTREIEPALAPFAMKAVLERMDDLLKKPARKAPPAAKVVALPDSKLRPRNVVLDRTAKIAAGVVMAAFLWFGARSMNFNRQSGSTPSFGSASDVSSVTASARPANKATEDAPKGPIAKIRRVIANRASVETTDSFRNGMANWGFASKAWAPGWSHHPDGYVRPGELALFQPSVKYNDYRLEFYGQIENKSVGWVVRAKDKQNYQAMKFTVIEPGLRPIIALVHYNVVGGKRGPKMQTPLNVMFHNNQPYHVAVDVKGSKFTTSIEGEQISTWTDTTLASGGIGFFSDAGERARLYWMKVSKNQDWLGRICSFIAGDGSSQTADLFRPAIPMPHREPASPAPQSRGALAQAFNNFSSPSRVKINKQQRTHSWNS
jgi:hypothetical protein